MRSKDHLILGKELSQRMLDNASSIERLLFVVGNILPDKLPHTYLCRLAEAEKYRGHNYNNTKNKVEAYMKELMDKEQLRGLDFIKLGIMCHYIADAFTYPHNSNYCGSLRDHVLYEGVLHDCILEGQLYDELENAANSLPCLKSSIFLFDLYNLYHVEYEKQKMGIANDIHYIGTASRVLVGNIVVSKNKGYDSQFSFSENPVFIGFKTRTM